MRWATLISLSGALLVTSISSFSDEKPMASWGVHTLVTNGRTTYEGDKIRAILVYGEIGNPQITIESIHVDMGYPSPNRVTWTAKVDTLGGMSSSCPIAETYYAIVKNLRWFNDTLLYDLAAPSSTLRCRVDGIKLRAPETICRLN